MFQNQQARIHPRFQQFTHDQGSKSKTLHYPTLPSVLHPNTPQIDAMMKAFINIDQFTYPITQ